MPAIPSWLLEPLWDQFAALLPPRPVYDPAHPLGCHRRRIPNRIVFEKLVQVLRFGCHRRMSDSPIGPDLDPSPAEDGLPASDETYKWISGVSW